MRHSYLDNYWHLDSIIHKIDARIKIVSIILFILFVVLNHSQSPATFALYSLLIAILILESKIPIRFILSRSLIVVPFVVMIAIFIPFFKEGEVIASFSFGRFIVTLTQEGAILFWNIIIKAYLSVLSVILLMASTRFPSFLKALEQIKIPKLFIMILSFMYRYIFVLEDELMIMRQAKEARCVNIPKWFNIKSLANMLGVLFLRSYERGENVYLAMCSRGFDGTIRKIDNPVLKVRDFVFLFFMIFALSAINIFGV